jgi:type IV secretion system protein VirB2
MNPFILRFLGALVAWLGVIASAAASTTGSLPWDAPLTTLANDLTGPVATALSTGGLFAAGGTLIWGGELGGFVAMCLRVVAAIALLVLGANFLSALGLTGAMVP